MNYYPHHIGDFNSATRHLTRIERSVYRDLIELYYDTEAPLSRDVDRLCRLLIARSDEEQAAVVQVLSEFFTDTEHGWRHVRCDAEIARYHGNKEAKSAAGKASAAKRARQAQRRDTERSQGEGGEDPSVQQPLNTGPTNQEPEPGTKSQEQSSTTRCKRASGFDASSIALPAWLAREDWVIWVKDRKVRKKPITEEGARRQLQQLAGYQAEGFTPRAVIAHSIASGYQGLFPPRTARREAPSNRARQRADWSSELRSVLAEGRARSEIDMGVIDASR
ncbi:YdaU family protein [Achromobacter sp. Bel]|uniref:YdaU family protein n=1 Tax=Achromobacter sp. Bel TaxID=2727415 RepID=UPI00145D6CAC|nr:YdaU family protein [Achromobacter sp. Bel]NMK48046.1 YdaU family protein [Achromobacter sp. Bel]